MNSPDYRMQQQQEEQQLFEDEDNLDNQLERAIEKHEYEEER